MKKYFLLLNIIAFGYYIPAQAQFDQLARLGSLGAHDGTVVILRYAEPLAVGFGAGLNTGWLLSSHPQGKRYPNTKFSLSVSVRTAIVQTPSSLSRYDASWMVDTNEISLLTQHVYFNNQNPYAPSYTGAKESYSYFNSNAQINGNSLYRFRLPGGTGAREIPLVFLQVGLGLWYDTDITIRYNPSMSLNLPGASSIADVSEFGKISLMGLSVRHGLNQWLPWGYKYPFEISLQAGYTKMNTTRNVYLYVNDILELNGTHNIQITNRVSADYLSCQKVLSETNAMTANLVLGRKFGWKYFGINVFAGGGVDYSQFNIALTGNYPTITYEYNSSNNVYQTVLNAVTDPINVDFVNDMNYRGFGGFRLYLGIIDFIGEFTYSQFFMYNLGVAISFNS